MSRSSRESDSTRSTRQRLEQKHGLKIGGKARADDDGLDDRAQRGLARENGPSAFGQARAPAAIRERINGDLMGRKDNR